MTIADTTEKLRVICIGLGNTGGSIARLLLERPDFEIVGAVEIDPAKVNCDLARVIGRRENVGVKVTADAKEALATPAELVIHATGSRLAAVMPELLAALRAKHNVISTCEELAEPWRRHHDQADELNRIAIRHGVSILGTGVNPGYAMDTWPLSLTGLCEHVDHVQVRRTVDASRRSQRLQKKIGVGMTTTAFAEAAARGEVGHVGLEQSASLLAKGLGWDLDAIEEKIEPLIATKRVVTAHFTVEPRFVTGVYQVARGFRNRVERVLLDLKMSVDGLQSSDEAWINGRPNLHSTIEGMEGDIATAAMIANAGRHVVAAPSGLLTMLDVPVVCGH